MGITIEQTKIGSLHKDSPYIAPFPYLSPSRRKPQTNIKPPSSRTESS